MSPSERLPARESASRGTRALLDKLADPPASRRPIPFWSWNDELEPAVLAEQARAMSERGIGGYFMHARGGLQTEYLGEDWMRCIETGVESGRELGLDAWAYDEEGWPSGFAGGRVPALSERYHGRWLSIERKDAAGTAALGALGAGVDPTRELLAVHGDWAIYAHRTPNYIDVLSAEAVKAFIGETHERYRARLGGAFRGLKGFFTDEPRLSGSIDRDMPWSLELPDRFRSEYGYDLAPALPSLFLPLPGHEALRYDFWRLVSRMFVDSFMRQIHDWCRASGCELTGHVMMEESVYVQMANTGGVMPFYEHMDMPGVDWLRRGIGSPIVPKQVGSVAAQLGRDRVITESFALSGWDVSLEELRWIAHWQYVNGVNMLCQHLSAYSLRGFRKRDYPPSLFYQEPWWDEYGVFNDYIARLGLFLSEGKSAAKVLLLHPIRSGWVMYDGRDYDGAMRELDAAFVRAAAWLSEGHLEYHLGDETIIEGHGSVDIGQRPELVVGECRYEAVVLPSMRCVGSKTAELLLEFAASGGQIIALGELPSLVDGRPDDRARELASVALPVDPSRLGPREALPSMATLCPSLVVADSAGGPQGLSQLGVVHMAVRESGPLRLVFLANLDRERGYRARIELPWDGVAYRVALESCELEELGPAGAGRSLELDFPAMGAHCLVVDTEAGAATREGASERAVPSAATGALGETIIRPEPDWSWGIAEIDDAALTLDECEYRVDEGEWQPPTPVIEIQRRLLELRRPCEVSLRFAFDSELPEGFGPLYLVLERAPEFRIELNGSPLEIKDKGYWKDRSFRKIDIGGRAKKGRNVLVLSRRFWQSSRVYEVLFGEGVYETEKNKLTYDVELESAYVVGDFAVASLSAYESGPRNSIHTNGPFVLRQRPASVSGGDLTVQGFAFFAGRIVLGRDLEVGPDGGRVILDLGHPRAALVEIRLNGRRAALLPWAPFRADLGGLARPGKNRLEVVLFSGNRNLLGPHHHSEGESYKVGPDSFTGRWSWVEKATEAFPASSEERARSYWKAGYSFVTFGLM